MYLTLKNNQCIWVNPLHIVWIARGEEIKEHKTQGGKIVRKREETTTIKTIDGSEFQVLNKFDIANTEVAKRIYKMMGAEEWL